VHPPYSNDAAAAAAAQYPADSPPPPRPLQLTAYRVRAR